MNIYDATFQEQVFDLVTGNHDLTRYPVSGAEYVKSEFEEGSYCFIAYQQMLDAYSSICERLQAEEWNDKDVEVIIGNLLSIGKHLSMKMFAYGVFFAKRENI